MRKNLLVAAILFFLLPIGICAQNYLMSNSNVSTCAGNFRDSGGNGLFGNYGNNENSTMTFCSNTAGQCVRITFTAFDLESGFDFLEVYNGPNTASPLIGVYTGTTSPGTVTGTSGCLTFVFTSDISVTSAGWNATISCVACAAGGGCLQTCSGGPAPANDACSGAQNLGLLPVPPACPNGVGAWLNTNTTNLCATAEFPYATLTGCNPSGNMASPASDVWYRFNLTGPTLNVSVTGGLQTPNVALYSGVVCNNLIGRGCEIGAGGILNATFGGLAAGTYYLQVSGGNLSDQCDFTLSLQNNYDCAGCVIQSSLAVNPAPVNGTYGAGQLVNFCFTISDYNQTSVNWLHAVVPTFGAGWDMTTLTPVMPANCSGDGIWGWYNSNVTSTATGLVHGPGFYYDSPLGDGNGGYPDGNPGDNFGDDNLGNLCDWTFCFSIRTKPAAQCVQGANLNIAIDTYGDGESGSWTSLACVGDPITEFFATTVCCQPPVVNVVDPTCPGQNGSATATGQGTGPWDYVWQNSSGVTIRNIQNLNGTDTYNSLPPGNYSVSVTDNTGCTSVANITIATITPIVAIANASATKCNRNDGGVTVIANGGTAPLTFSNNNGTTFQAGNTFNNLAPGNYTIVVRDDNGCTVSQVVNVAPSVIPVISGTPVVNVTCNGGSNGSITVNVSNGNPPFQYSINNGLTNQAGNNFPGLTSGAYAVLVTDADGCTATANVNVAQPPVINISNIAPVSATCGTNNGSLDITAAGGTGALQYSITGGAPYQASNIFNNLAAGNYNVVVIDANGCTQTASPAISNTAAPVINSAPLVALLCNGGNTASITVNASGGTGALQYSNNNGTTFQAGNVFAGLSAGNYDIVVRDAAGCMVNLNVVIANPPSIVIATVPTGAVCTQPNGSLVINANGGTGALQYSINNGSTFQAANSFNALVTGNYNIVVRDANGCTSNTVVNIPDAPPPTIATVTPTNVDCNGANNGAIVITANGGAAPLEYSINNGGTYFVSNSFNSLAPGNYQIVVRDVNGCTVTVNTNVAQPTALAVNSVPANATCSQSNGSVVLNANGGTAPYQYSTDGGATFQASNTFNGLPAGNYSIVVTDANGCVVNSGANIADDPGPRIDATAVVNVNCFGANNGSITVTASNGTAPLQYSNNNGATWQPGNNFAGLVPGAYNIVVRDANGCTATIVDNIVQPTQVVITGTPVVNVLCNGGNTGSITINANGGTGLLQFSITGGAPYQASNQFSNLTQGNYNVVVIDANGCTTTSAVNIIEPTPVAINNTPSVNVDCNGANNGSITINANGGTAPLQYSINSGTTYQAGNGFNNLAPANYSIIVQDANGCTATSAVNIIEPTPVAINNTPSVNVDCNGANNGSIVINANGGTAPLQYSINNGVTYQAGNAFNNLAPANYSIIVQDANGCTATSAVNIIEPTPVAINNTPSVNVDCNGANNGSIIINANGGTAPLQYSINNGATYQAGNSFNNLAPANYSVVVQDANGCTATSAVNIVEPTAVVIAGTPIANVVCNGGNTGSIAINANGGTGVLQYSITGGAPYQVSNQFNNLLQGNYNVVVIDANGCTATSAVNVVEPTAVVIAGTPFVNVNCNGANNGSIAINANGGTAPLQYSINNGVTYQAGNAFNNLAPANYVIVVQDANGCTATSAVNIIEPTPVAINNTPSVNVDCNGANNGSIVINANGGTAPLQYSINNGITYQAGNAFNNLAPANYSIIVQDASGCTAISAVNIVEPTPVVINSTPSVNVNCNGANNGSITINANGGTAPLQYSINNGTTYQAGNAFNNLTPANYSLVVQDANGCTATSAVNIVEPTAVVISGTPSIDVNCNGANNGSITINANGGTAPLQYSINNGTTYQAGNAFNNLAPANYSIVVQDANGCTTTSAVNIIQPTPLALNSNVVDANCGNANGAITINANGGTAPYQYSINNGATFQAANNFPGLPANNYNIVVLDANGCLLNGNTAVNNLAAPVINATPFVNILCNGGNNGSITINANGGTGALQYSIDGGATFSANNIFNNLVAGNYSIVVRDAASCQAASAVVIVEPTQLAFVPNLTGTTCSAANGSIVINANGGTAPYQYSINNGTTYQGVNSFNNIASGAYQLSVRDANGCIVNANANIIDAPAPTINNVTPTNLTCNGSNDGTISITATGGTAPLQYSINNGSTFQAGSQFANLTVGNYIVLVEDANGCTVTNAANIIQPAAIVVNSNSFNANCGQADGSLTVVANGGSGALQYSINGGVSYQASPNFNNIFSGNYSIVVQDANGCTQSATGIVNSNAAPAISNVTSVDIDCNGANNGVITITANGGTGALQYSINNGTTFQSSSQFANLAVGNYAIVVQDASGCSVTQAVQINEPPAMIMNANTVGSTCGIANGSVAINVNGGTAPYQYSINNGATFQVANTFANLPSGSCQLVVQDANGCTISQNTNVGSAPAAVINNVNANDISCNGLADGSIAITTSGGTLPLQFSINNGGSYQAGSAFNNLSAGNYQVVVQDANGCLTNSNAVIAQPPAIALNSNTVNSNCNAADGSLVVNANGGTGVFTYSIDNGASFQSSSTFNFLTAGNYSIIVQDANGCTNTIAVTVNNNAAPAISNVVAIDITCNGANNGTITVTANGGTGALQYSINNGSVFQHANVFINLSPGNYAIVVQDGNGCNVTSAAVIIEPPLLVMNSNTTTSTCGNVNGSIAIIANGGIAPLQYSNDNGTTFQAGSSFANVASGNYQLIVTDANGCTASANASVASAPSPIINNIASTDLTCNGSNDGSIAIAITGGTPPIQFSIDNGTTYQVNNQFVNVVAGNYQVVVQDANGCTANSNTVVAQPAAIAYNIVVNDATCGSSNGSLTINANGGAGNLTYSVNNGASFQNGNVFNSLIANNYSIVVQDANGCTVGGIATVANMAAPVIITMPVMDASCNNLSDGSIVINVNGGNGSLTYSINGGITTQPGNTFNNLSSGNYSIVVTDATGCSVTATAVINQPPAINVNVNTTTATCGVANGSVVIVASGGAGALQYSINNGNTFQANGNFANQLAGNYSIIVQDANGCTAASNAAVQNTNAPVIAATPYTDVTCNGLSNGSIVINANGGTAPLQYSVNNGVVFQGTNQFLNLGAGVWQIVVQDAVGCLATSAVNIIEPPAILFNTVPTPSTCGNANGQLLVNALGGTAPLQYSNNNGLSYQPGNNFINLAANNYNIVVQDANGCTVAATSAVANLSGPIIANTVPSNVTCNGDNDGEITITANGGTGVLQYSIDNGANYQSGNIFSNVSPGNYLIVVQDANGCTVTGSAIIAQPSALLLNANSTGSTCSYANGAIVLAANGGTLPYQYSIDNGISFSAVANFNNLLAGNYSVVVQDGNGCETISAVNVVDAPAPTIASTVPTDVTCYGLANGIVNITANGGATPLQYSIDNGVTFQLANQFTNVAVGNWQIVVQDANGCTANSSVLIAQPQQINYMVAVTPGTCGNANGILTFNNVTGGTGVYQYSINNGATFQIGNQFAGLPPGNCQLIVTDANACDVPNSATINNIPGPIVSALTLTDVDCFGNSTGSIDIIPQGGTGPFQYSVNNGASFQSGSIFNGLIAGNYQIVVQDGNGCLADSIALINEPTAVNYNVASAVATCGNANGNLILNASGGSGNYVYSINNGLTFQPSGSFPNLSTGNYQIVVQDANNCAASGLVNILSAPSPVLALSATTDVTCFGYNNGSIIVSSNSGTSPFTFSLNGGNSQPLPNFTNLIAGNYSIVIVDSNGCADTVTTTITQPLPVALQTNTTNVLCHGGNNGTANVFVNGGVSPYTYQWSGGAGSNAHAVNLSATTYTVTVTDANNCNANATVTVNQPSALASTPSSANVTCFGLSNGWAAIQVAGGVTPYQYVWSHAASNSPAANNLAAGNYSLTVTDANGCTMTHAYSIAQPTQISANANAVNVSCYGGNNGSIAVNANGGAGSFNYSLNNGNTYQPLNHFANLSANSYQIIVQDANGCTTAIQSTVQQPTQLTSIASATNILCFGQTNGVVNVVANGGTQPYSYLWSGGTTVAQVSNLAQGTYSVIVTDANGCTVFASATIAQPTAIAAAIAAVPTICIGQNTSLSASASGGVPPYIFKWNTGYTGNPLAVAPSVSTNYNVVVNDANGCSTTPVYRTVDVHPALAVVVSPNDTICEGESVTLLANPTGGNGGPYTFIWTGVTSSSSTINVSPVLTTTYTVTINDGCTVLPAQSTSTVKVNPLPDISFLPDPAEGCVPLTVNFSNATLNGGDYKWQFGDGNTSGHVTPTHVYTEPGVYDVTLEATSADGCYNIYVMDDAVSVFENPIAKFTAEPPRTTILKPEIQFKDISVGANRWYWDFGDVTGINNQQHPGHTYKDTGTYKVTLIVASYELCYDTTYGEVIIDGDVTMYVPNAFSPNNDGKNEVFNVYSIGIISADLNIYDRWGNLVYHQNNSSPHWNGRNRMDNKPCQQGVYVYVLQARDIFGKSHKYTGTVTLIR